MRTVATIAVWLLICTVSFAADQDTEIKSQVEKETAEVKPKERAKQEEVRGEKQPQWPRPYQPREEISADATVPFPTDI